MEARNRNLWLVVFTIAVDAFGFGILLPVIPQLLTSPSSPFYLLAPDTSVKTGYLLIGCLSASYPMMQFFSTPLLGQLSDRYGRKPILAVSLAGTSIGYVMFALAVISKNIPLLFAARLLDGLTGGNTSVADAAIADITEPKDRTRSFGLAMGAFGLGLIAGPLIGGTLADPSIVSWFDVATPFWFAAILAALNTTSISLLMTETTSPRRGERLDLTRNLKNVAAAYAQPESRSILATQFFTTMANSLLLTFFGVFLIDRFSFDDQQLAHFFGYIGICVIFTQFVTLRAAAKRFTEPRVLRVSIVGAAAVVAAYLLPTSARWLFVIAPLVATFNGLTLSNLTGLLSRSAPAGAQGEIMGIGRSVQALAMAVPPLLAGSFATVLAPAGVVAAAALAHLVGWIVFTRFYRADS